MTRVVTTLLGLLTIVAVAGLAWGDYPVPPGELLALLLRPAEAPPHVEMIVVGLRMPRLALGILAGAAFAVAGAITQAIMRNPLAEPGILGINAGAALGVMIVLVGLKNAPAYLAPPAGFVGSSAMALAIYLLSWRNGTSSLRIVLIGIGLGSLAGAATTTLTAFGAITDVQRALIWLTGSVYHADWHDVRMLALWLFPPFVLTFASFRQLDLVRFGDTAALGLGQRVDLVRAMMIVLCALISGAAVAATGLIAFIGLVAPHLARRLVGPMHAKVLPVCALVGALLVPAADFLGRAVLAPVQVPAGIVTALIGAPFFGFLLWRHRNAAA
ncbi:FecCD family ABC transporter permease [Roseibium aggregatum]|uniref:Iron ABC transporter permease n=1 Tax=Roseibium aggregatum TaxID=187304 RepID=A0A939EB86_9HYPH|nr:iron ABC transporter permease [Roseibium aggregatum]MBN9668888.1 iron ABC transporter permease [Roseibium aggregatum]